MWAKGMTLRKVMPSRETEIKYIGDCRRGKRRDNTKLAEQKSPIVFIFFLISQMLIVRSIRGVILKLPLSGNSKIYEVDLTFLIGIRARCQPSVCTIIFKCFPSIF